VSLEIFYTEPKKNKKIMCGIVVYIWHR
jgi:hypothetical protein